jgi:hypothetical protein
MVRASIAAPTGRQVGIQQCAHAERADGLHREDGLTGLLHLACSLLCVRFLRRTELAAMGF